MKPLEPYRPEGHIQNYRETVEETFDMVVFYSSLPPPWNVLPRYKHEEGKAVSKFVDGRHKPDCGHSVFKGFQGQYLGGWRDAHINRIHNANIPLAEKFHYTKLFVDGANDALPVCKQIHKIHEPTPEKYSQIIILLEKHFGGRENTFAHMLGKLRALKGYSMKDTSHLAEIETALDNFILFCKNNNLEEHKGLNTTSQELSRMIMSEQDSIDYQLENYRMNLPGESGSIENIHAYVVSRNHILSTIPAMQGKEPGKPDPKAKAAGGNTAPQKGRKGRGPPKRQVRIRTTFQEAAEVGPIAEEPEEETSDVEDAESDLTPEYDDTLEDDVEVIHVRTTTDWPGEAEETVPEYVCNNDMLYVFMQRTERPKLPECPICPKVKGERIQHLIFQCETYEKMNLAKRREALNRLERCFNCTAPGHTANDCKSTNRCRNCGKRHHTSICPTPGDKTKAPAKGILTKTPSA